MVRASTAQYPAGAQPHILNCARTICRSFLLAVIGRQTQVPCALLQIQLEICEFCRFELTPSRTYQLKSHSLAGLDGYKCGAETSLALYLANDAVQKAIHVEQTKGKEGQTYTLTVPDLRPLYTCAPRLVSCS